MKMSWVTLDRICREEARADDIRRMVESTGRPLRSSAEHLSDEELLEKLRGFGVDLDRAGLEKLCEGALSAEEVARPLQGRRGIGRDGQFLPQAGDNFPMAVTVLSCGTRSVDW